MVKIKKSVIFVQKWPKIAVCGPVLHKKLVFNITIRIYVKDWVQGVMGLVPHTACP
jgi:hypothetical protein